jgi:hypothetical protein
MQKGKPVDALPPVGREWAQARHEKALELAWKRLPKLHRPGYSTFLNLHITAGCPLHRS